MTYLDLINGFFLWLESNALPASSRLMYLSLLNVFNRAGWPDDVQVDNRRLMSMAGVATEKSAIRARDALVSAGFITYRKGGSHNPNRYSLNLYCPQNSKNDSINDSIKYRENDSKNDSINDSLIKTKTKTKNPPKSPQGDLLRGGARNTSQEVELELLLTTGEMHPVSREQADRSRELYPAVDVSPELRNMAAWPEGNPTKS